MTIRLVWPVSLALVWTLFWTQYVSPLPASAQWLFHTLYLAAVVVLLRPVELRFHWGRSDTLVAAGILAVLLAAHLPWLGQPLGGDELYHAERAALLIGALGRAAERMREVGRQWPLESMWRIFDLRFWAVNELWRAVSFGAIAVTLAIAAGLRALEPRRRTIVLGVLTVAFAVAGALFSLSPENHPPLRLLPVFVTHVLFGIDSWVFRLPGVLACAGVCLVLYRFIDDAPTRGHKVSAWAVVVAVATAFVPVTFYVAEALEPSIFGYAAWVTVLVLLARGIVDRERTESSLILAGIVTGLGVLARQPVAVLWPGVGAVYLWAVLTRRLPLNLITPLRIFVLGVAAVPYFVSVSRLGHVANGERGSVIASLTSGIGPMAMLNSTTVPWVIAFVIALVGAAIRLRSAAMVMLLFVPTYVVYYTIWPYLWGVGRYQAEYVTPFIAFAMAAAASLVKTRAPKLALGATLGLLCLGTLNVNQDLNQDVAYAEWPRMRITTSAYFPYDQALSYLQREESGGQFALLGGSPWYNDFVLWQHGFDFDAARRWRGVQAEIGGELASVRTITDLAAACRGARVGYLAVQKGSKRERQHQSDAVRRAIALLNQAQIAPFVRDLSFVDRFGGIIDVYRLAE